ncbi:MAG: lipid II:glycine glycyltransferase FemX [Solirubrobacteraceae bacterium]
MPYTVSEPTAGPEWDAFIEDSGGQFTHAYHLSAWREVHRRAYGREPIYMAARGADGELVGGLPLVVHGGALRALAASLKPGARAASGGQRLSSVIRGGPVGSDGEARGALLAAACALIDERGLGELWLETDVPGCEELVAGLQVESHPPAWLTPLPRDSADLLNAWRKQSKNLSRNLAKAKQRGVIVRGVRSRRDLWRFYRQYVLTMRRHRAVPRSWLEIRSAHKLLAPTGRCRVWLGEYRGDVVAGAMFLSAGASFELLYAGSDLRANDVRPTHAVYWHALEWAIANHKTVVDWGTAPVDSSLGNFKRQWGAEPVDSFRYTYQPRAQGPSAAPHPRTDESSDSMGQAVWDRIPVDALGVAATVAHRLL